MLDIKIDQEYIMDVLFKLLNIPSPSGYTDQIVHFVGNELERLGVPYELTRVGAIRGIIKGKGHSPDRAVVSHLDTLGAMVRCIKDNTRLGITPLGSWSSRFAEGARVTIFTDSRSYRGTILPLKASGHAYGDDVDTQPVTWENLEIRIDAICDTKKEVCDLGINVGDFVAVDPMPEWSPSGYINSRHLDDKAGVAAQLAAIKAILDQNIELPVDYHPLFSIHEEIGYGASSMLFKDISALVVVDNSIIAPGQNSSERGVTIAMKDSVGPFDYHLTRKLIRLCKENEIVHHRDTFKYYRCDAASAVEAGNDIRTALVCFELDASHGYERTHIESLVSLAKLLVVYLQSPVDIRRDAKNLGSLKGFPRQVEKPFRKEGNLYQAPENN